MVAMKWLQEAGRTSCGAEKALVVMGRRRNNAGSVRDAVGGRRSTILMTVLMRLIREAIPELPMHDGLMVPQSARDITNRIMLEESSCIAGVNLPVAVKG
jgi:hypothetical protein